jgi:hypothetical protein
MCDGAAKYEAQNFPKLKFSPEGDDERNVERAAEGEAEYRLTAARYVFWKELVLLRHYRFMA